MPFITVASASKSLIDLSDAYVAIQNVLDMFDDNKLTPNEKQQLKKELDIIVKEKLEIVDEAGQFGIIAETNNFTADYNDLYNYINPKLADLSTVETVDGALLRTYFADYTNTKEILLTKIYHEAKTRADNAQSTATSANNAVTDMASDSKLTPIEKQRLKQEWDIIMSEKILLDGQAGAFEITTERTTYTNFYTNTLSPYVTPLVADISTTSTITGSVLRDNFKTYYDNRTALINAISTKAKSLANIAQDTVDNLVISGRNLVLNSNFSSGSDYWEGTANGAIVKEENVDCFKIDGALATTKLVHQAIPALMSTTYTLSGLVKVTNRVAGTTNPHTQLYIEFFNNDTYVTGIASGITMNANTTGFERKDITFTTPATTFTHIRVQMYIRDATGTFFFAELKLEKGNRATEWSLAPEDQATKTLIDKVDYFQNSDSIISSILQSADYTANVAGYLSSKADAAALANYATAAKVDEVEGKVSTAQDDINTIKGTPYVVQNDLVETAKDLTRTFANGGGINVIRNSVGLSNNDFWTVTGSVVDWQNTEIEEHGALSGFYVPPSAKLSQTIKVVQGIEYTFSSMVKKDSASSGYIKIINGTETKLVSLVAGSALSYHKFDTSYDYDGGDGNTPLPFVTQGATVTLELGANAGGTGLLFVNAMGNIGPVPLEWQHAPDEIYNTNIKMNMNGIKVQKKDQGNIVSYTVMTPEKFAGYYDVDNNGTIDEAYSGNDEVFLIDKDNFKMKKAVVRDEITMDLVKVIPMNGASKGWAFVANSE